MKNILLLYESQTGFTQRYAQWIGQELKTTAIPLRDCTRSLLSEADLVIFGGSVRGSIISGQSKVERMLKRIGGKPVIWFSTGIRPGTPRTMDLIRKNNFSKDENVEFFYFRGGMTPEKLSQGDKTLILCYRAMIKRRSSRDPEDDAVLSLLRNNCDFTDISEIQPLIDTVRTILSA